MMYRTAASPARHRSHINEPVAQLRPPNETLWLSRSFALPTSFVLPAGASSSQRFLAFTTTVLVDQLLDTVRVWNARNADLKSTLTGT